jgi:ADP-ribosyl-[dinitrogen reductase] hydrolase
MSSLPPAPLPNSYWVLPGRLLAGEYPATAQLDGTRERIDRLVRAGIDCFVDLTPSQELPPYDNMLPPGIAHHRLPIRDHDIPAQPELMSDILSLIDRELRSGRKLYVHCHAGVGRTGMVMGCFLVESGLSGDAALEELNRAWQQSARSAHWPQVPETDGQTEYVRSWSARVSAPRIAAPASFSAPFPADERGLHTLRGRFLGALIGLATGDALAAATEQWEPGTFEPVKYLTGGGVYDLPPGAWTDDTSMALLLGESLLACRGFDARDQIDRYLRWRQEGYQSATDRCIGLRPGVAQALAAAQWRRQPFSGSHEPRQLDPEPLSRIAPAVLFAFPALDEAVRLAGDAARTTCQAPTVIDACRTFAAMLHAALQGAPKEQILYPPLLAQLDGAAVRPHLRSLLRGNYRRKQPGKMRSGSTTTQVLEAALWAFDRTSSFAEGALLAVNLGGNSDVVGAVYGQLAGAHYTVAGIPAPWRSELSRVSLIENLADELFRVSQARA